MNPLSVENIVKYNSSRNIHNTNLLCHAPFRNIYFNSCGNPAACWLSFFWEEDLSKTTIKDVWFGQKFQKLRESIRAKTLDYKCTQCRKHLEEQNFVNVLAKAYDSDAPIPEYPTIMEFELENTCNLECTMCFGNLSSSIRTNRDHQPPLPKKYTDNFIQELEEFIPYLEEARFNGGEVFLIQPYYKIWEMIIRLKPSIKIVLATNGTILNDQIKELLPKGNFHINLSLDSLNKQTYETIRKNAILEKTLENLTYFHQFTKIHNRTLCLVANPMNMNWQEMPDLVAFANKLDIPLWFNTIIRPEDLSIWALPAAKIQEIYATLSAYRFDKPQDQEYQKMHNISVYENLVYTQIKNWLQEATIREQNQ